MRIHKLHVVLAAVFLLPCLALAQSGTADRRPELLYLLGLSPPELLAQLGHPERMHAVRGEHDWQDDVVLVWPRLGLAAYVWQDRTWQLAMLDGCDYTAAGFHLSSGTEALAALFGRVLAEGQGWSEWHVPNMAWPVRLRVLYNEAGGVQTAYLYRADF